MTQNDLPASEREQRLSDALAACLEAAEKDQDPHEMLARYAEFAPELERFFADREKMNRLAGPVREVTAAARQAAAAVRVATPGPDETVHDLHLSHTAAFGDYELLEPIGHGGMGVVYKARQRSLNRLVALKVIRAGQLAKPAELERFRAEAEMVATLDHSGIVPIYEIGEWPAEGGCPPLPFFSMKLIEGGSLAEKVASGQCSVVSKETNRRVARMLADIADTVHHAHQRGILHRDLKPSNILLDRDGRPHVTDFGLAKRLAKAEPAGEGESVPRPAETLSYSGALVGTPSYMAPEQAQGRQGAITTATDVYGLGALLYALLTGKAPFQGDSALDTLLQVKEREPEPPRKCNPCVERDLETICLKALAKDAGRRYGSAADLAAELRRYLTGEAILARPVGRAEKAWRWCRRNPGMAGLAAAVVVLLVGMTITSMSAAIAAGEREEVALAREEEANHRERERTRETLIQKIQLIRSSTHSDGWREKAWSLVREAAEIRTEDKDLHLRNEAAAILAGLDAYTVKRWESDTPMSTTPRRWPSRPTANACCWAGPTAWPASRCGRPGCGTARTSLWRSPTSRTKRGRARSPLPATARRSNWCRATGHRPCSCGT